MKIEAEGETVRVSEVDQLVASGSADFRSQVLMALENDQRNIEIDLRETAFVDSSGLGVLISLYKAAAERSGMLRLLNPQPAVMQILRLTRMNRVFQIEPSEFETLRG